MIEILEGFPDDVLAMRFSGEITAEQYKETLIPAAQARFERHKQVRIYSELAAKTVFTPGSLWEDWKLGLSEWHRWGSAAIVTDEHWVRALTLMLRPFFMPQIRLFSLADGHEAKAWIDSATAGGAAETTPVAANAMEAKPAPEVKPEPKANADAGEHAADAA